MVLSIVLLLVGFVLLIVGADKLVDGASSVSRNFNIPNIVIGLTIVAFGTSAPELVVNVLSSLEGHTGLVMGNVVGSNIFNVCGILGVCALFAPLTVQRKTTWLEIPFNILTALMLLVLCADIYENNANENILTRGDGIILLGFFVIFLVYNINLAVSNKNEVDDADVLDVKRGNRISILLIIIGLVGLVIGGKLIVDNAVQIASAFGLSEMIVGLTIVSIGTSLPELATSIAAVRKGKLDIAMGNVIGSNIFNISFVLGISAIICSVPVPNSSFFDLFFNLAISILLFAFVLIRRKKGLQKLEAIFFLSIYLAYTAYLVMGNN